MHIEVPIAQVDLLLSRRFILLAFNKSFLVSEERRNKCGCRYRHVTLDEFPHHRDAKTGKR